MPRIFRRLAVVSVVCCSVAVVAAAARAAKGRSPENLFGNASFELGRDLWQLDRDGQTAARFAVDDRDAAAGRRSAVLTIDKATGWGVQFGQTIEAPAVGKTYTFAVMARSAEQPVAVALEIERRGSPYDRAVGQKFTIKPGAWTELHATFKIEKTYPEGWFAYVSCKQPGAEFRLDVFRLCEGPYVAYENVARQEAAAAGVSLLDTGAEGGPMPADFKKAGWTKVPEDDTGHRFNGDAVLMNDRLALVLRRGAAGAELYGRGPDGQVLRATLIPVGTGGRAAGKLKGVYVIENTPGQVLVDADFETGNLPSLRFELAMGQPFVKTEARGAAAALSVEAPCRFLVLPDFFADDIVVDAHELPVTRAELPSENFLLHLLPGQDAMVMSVASRRERDARIELGAGSGKLGARGGKLIRRSQMDFGPGGKIWVALLEGRNIWHHHDVRREEAGQIVPLEWTAPWPAQSRVDWRLAGGLTASWEMIAQTARGAVREVGLVRRGPASARRPQALDHRAGVVSLSLLDRSGRPRLSAAAGQAGALPGPGRDLPHHPRAADAPGRVRPGGRGAGHAGRRPLRVHPRRRGPGHGLQGPRHLRHPRPARAPSTPPSSRRPSGPRSSRPLRPS